MNKWCCGIGSIEVAKLMIIELGTSEKILRALRKNDQYLFFFVVVKDVCCFLGWCFPSHLNDGCVSDLRQMLGQGRN